MKKLILILIFLNLLVVAIPGHKNHNLPQRLIIEPPVKIKALSNEHFKTNIELMKKIVAGKEDIEILN